MRTDTLEAMQKALEMYPSKTTKDYAEMTGLSLVTTYNALDKVKARKVAGTYPVQWIPANADQAQGTGAMYVDEEGNLKYDLDLLPTPEDLSTIEGHSLDKFASLLNSLTLDIKLLINSHTDIEKYAHQVAMLAENAMRLHWHTRVLKDLPEWKIEAGIVTDITKE